LTLKLAIENFKSIEKVELELEDVTVLVGPPAAGKSNILDALAVLGYFNRFKVLDREYGNSGANLEPLSHIARFQSADQLFRYRDLTNPVRLGLLKDVEMRCEISYVAGTLRITMSGDKSLAWDLVTLRHDPMSEIQGIAKALPSFESRLYGFDRYGLMCGIFVLPYICGLHVRLANLSTARAFPSSILSELGWNAPYIVRRHGRPVNEINDVLREHIDERVELKVRKTGEALLFDYDYEVDPVGVSDAIFRTLYFLLALESSQFYVKRYGLEKKFVALLEEPEAHVFPYFLDLLIDYINKAANNIYVVVTTHNPLFLSLLQDRVKNVRTYYVYRLKGGSTFVKELDVERMAKELVTSEDILFKSPSEVLKKYTKCEVTESAEDKTSAG